MFLTCVVHGCVGRLQTPLDQFLPDSFQPSSVLLVNAALRRSNTQGRASKMMRRKTLTDEQGLLHSAKPHAISSLTHSLEEIFLSKTRCHLWTRRCLFFCNMILLCNEIFGSIFISIVFVIKTSQT